MSSVVPQPKVTEPEVTPSRTASGIAWGPRARALEYHRSSLCTTSSESAGALTVPSTSGTRASRASSPSSTKEASAYDWRSAVACRWSMR